MFIDITEKEFIEKYESCIYDECKPAVLLITSEKYEYSNKLVNDMEAFADTLDIHVLNLNISNAGNLSDELGVYESDVPCALIFEDGDVRERFENIMDSSVLKSTIKYIDV